MTQIAIITGAGSGIGQALAWELAAREMQVLAVGRRKEMLEQTRARAPQYIHVVSADVATPQGCQAIVQALPGPQVRFLVHNAAVLEPVDMLAKIKREDWRQAMAVNVEGPLFLTQSLLPYLDGGRVLHISSGAAHHPYAGWGAYCTTKAALYMLLQVWREECREQNIRFGSARPGVVDTPMQALIRQTSAARFPRVERFVQLKQNGLLVSPADAATFLAWVLLATTDREFNEQEFDINETQAHWHAFRAPEERSQPLQR